MQAQNLLFKNVQNGKLLFLLSIFISAFWIVGKNINVYQTKITGAIFEILWLPMILLLFITPCLAAYFWKKEKFVLKSMNLLTIIASVIFVLILVL
jgi:hypothetical protein